MSRSLSSGRWCAPRGFLSFARPSSWILRKNSEFGFYWSRVTSYSSSAPTCALSWVLRGRFGNYKWNLVLMRADDPICHQTSLMMPLHQRAVLKHKQIVLQRTGLLKCKQGCPTKDRPLSAKDGRLSVWHADQMRRTDICLSGTRIKWHDHIYGVNQPTNQGTMTLP